MRTFEARTAVPADPARVISLLTDPFACSRWSPVPFELEELDEAPLRSGSRARIGGRLAGRRVSFDLSVLEASDRRLSLRAIGPCEVQARYETEPAIDGTEVQASVSVASCGGIRSRLVSAAAEALLAGGLLARTLERLSQEMKPSAISAA
jgi:hypothetical protein